MECQSRDEPIVQRVRVRRRPGQRHDVEMPSYLDFVRAEGEYRGSPDWEADREYFIAKYRDVEPALFARSGSMHSRRRRHHALRVSPETAQRIRDTIARSSRSPLLPSASTCAGYTAAAISCSGSRSSTGHPMPNSAPSAAW